MSVPRRGWPDRRHHLVAAIGRVPSSTKATPEKTTRAIRKQLAKIYEQKFARGERLFEPGRCDGFLWWKQSFGGE